MAILDDMERYRRAQERLGLVWRGRPELEVGMWLVDMHYYPSLESERLAQDLEIVGLRIVKSYEVWNTDCDASKICQMLLDRAGACYTNKILTIFDVRERWMDYGASKITYKVVYAYDGRRFGFADIEQID